MKKYQIHRLFYFVLTVNFLNVYSLKCRTGFAISQPRSKELRYSFDNTNPQPDCEGSENDNPALKPRGCFKNVYKLSSGNIYAEYGCFTAQNNPIQTGQYKYDDQIHTHVCLTENCNGSNNLKFNLTAFFALLLISFKNLF